MENVKQFTSTPPSQLTRIIIHILADIKNEPE